MQKAVANKLTSTRQKETKYGKELLPQSTKLNYHKTQKEQHKQINSKTPTSIPLTHHSNHQGSKSSLQIQSHQFAEPITTTLQSTNAEVHSSKPYSDLTKTIFTANPGNNLNHPHTCKGKKTQTP